MDGPNSGHNLRLGAGERIGAYNAVRHGVFMVSSTQALVKMVSTTGAPVENGRGASERIQSGPRYFRFLLKSRELKSREWIQ